MPSVALTIAGSDPSGGAGIQADLKTFHAFGVYGAAVVATLTVQNTTGVRAVRSLDAEWVAAELAAVLDDLPVRAAKTGLLVSAPVIETVADAFVGRSVSHLVVDPVFAATNGTPLVDAAARTALRTRLLPLATLVTPNLAEAEALLGVPVRDLRAMRAAAQRLVELGASAALVTGGHLDGPPWDVLYAGGTWCELPGARIVTPGTHGTGCTLSAAITAGLAAGRPLDEAVARAKQYVTRALASATPIGRGNRPLDHHAPVEDP